MTRGATTDGRRSGDALEACCGNASVTTPGALNGTPAPRTKTMTAGIGFDACVRVRRRRMWASLAIALVAIASVLAGELWAFREAPALASTAKSEVVTDVDGTLARVVAASVLIAPAN